MRPLDEAVLRVRRDDEAVEHEHATSVRTRGDEPVTPSHDLMRRLARVNPIMAFVIALALMLAGLFLPGIIGAALLFVLAGGLAALTFTTWPVQSPTTRTLRLVLLTLLLAAVVAKIL
ncbi:MAG: DUF6703 family protein [Actinoplanes sp.]